MPSTLLLYSGGLDSTVLLYDLLSQGQLVSVVMFSYGQKHMEQELSHARLHCAQCMTNEHFGGYLEVTIPTLKGSNLTDGGGSKVVPNRNAVMLSIAVSIAAAHGTSRVAYACNFSDQQDFPDCRPAFVEAMNGAVQAAQLKVAIVAPYIELTKRQVVQIGKRLEVPMQATWSCYAGGYMPCGKCDACKAREGAFSDV